MDPVASLAAKSASHDVEALQQSLVSVPSIGPARPEPDRHHEDAATSPISHGTSHVTTGTSATGASGASHASADSTTPAPGTASIPQFSSALSFAVVRDFAYPDFHPLHYGVPRAPSSLPADDIDDADYYDDYDSHQREARFDDGPPWQQDSDLVSPVIKSPGTSKEFQFSVGSADEINGRAVALFDFTPENDNEAPLYEGQIIWISYRHGQGWLVAEDPETRETGLVPESYVRLLASDGSVPPDDEPQIYESPESDSEGWVDEDVVSNDHAQQPGPEAGDEHH